MRHLIRWSLLPLLFLAVPATAEEPAAVIARLQEKANAHENVQFTMLQSMQAEGVTMMEATAQVAYSGQNTAIDMQMQMLAPQQMNMQTRTIIADDVVWTHMPMMNMVNKIDLARVRAEAPEAAPALEQRPGNLLGTFEGHQPDYHGTEAVSGETTHHFTVTAAQQQQVNSGMGLPEVPTSGDIDMWIADVDGLPRRLIAKDENGQPVVTVNFTDIVLNAELAPERFQFTPPPGAQVMDTTDMVLAAIKGENGAPGMMPGGAPPPQR